MTSANQAPGTTTTKDGRPGMRIAMIGGGQMALALAEGF